MSAAISFIILNLSNTYRARRRHQREACKCIDNGRPDLALTSVHRPPSDSTTRKSSGKITSLETSLQNLSVSENRAAKAANAPRAYTAVDPSSGAETRWDLNQPNQQSESSSKSYNPKRVLELEGRKNQQVLKGSFDSPSSNAANSYVVAYMCYRLSYQRKPAIRLQKGESEFALCDCCLVILTNSRSSKS